jgi:hypothetical protein
VVAEIGPPLQAPVSRDRFPITAQHSVGSATAATSSAHRKAQITPINRQFFARAVSGHRNRRMIVLTSIIVSTWLADATHAAHVAAGRGTIDGRKWFDQGLSTMTPVTVPTKVNVSPSSMNSSPYVQVIASAGGSAALATVSSSITAPSASVTVKMNE